MRLFEVRVKTDSGIFAGYFDNETAALSAVEQLGSYTAAWSTLNSLRSAVLTPDTVINAALVRTNRTAADEHIARREWLLLDFDPPRPTGTNSTDAEKESAWQQAEQCRKELTAMGWPAPAAIDSGNGFHLRYRIDLPNDADAHGLVRSVLHSLAARYAMLDVTNCNAARVAKLPGTWARKGEHTAERPHRISRLLEAAGDSVVSEAQLRAIAPQAATGRDYGPPEEISGTDAKAAREWLLGYLEHYDLVARTETRRIMGGWKIAIYCPLTQADTQPHDEGGETSTVLQLINGRLSFKCSHHSCEKAGRNTLAFKRTMYARRGGFRREPGEIAVTLGRRK